ncbi:MAG: hypothetical protein ACP5QK_10740, partial [Myxococcota bacterium]
MRLFLTLLILSTFFFSGCHKKQEPIKAEYNRPKTLAEYDTIRKEIYKEPIGPETDQLKFFGKINEGETLSVALYNTGIDYKIAEQIIMNLKGV